MPSPPALASQLRGPAVVAAALAAAGTLALGIHYAGTSGASRTDLRLDAAVAALVPDPGIELQLVHALGDPGPVVVGALLLAAICVAVGRRRLALVAVLGPGLTGVATTALKPVFGRVLEGGFAYPSGHTAAVTALGLVVALLVTDLVRAGPAAGALLLALGAVGGGTLMAVSLIALDIHYPTDTVGGFGTAVALVVGSAVLVDAFAVRRAARWSGRA